MAKGKKQKDEFDMGLEFDYFEDAEKVTANMPAILTEEIKSFRQTNKEFAATNEHDTYLIIVFSCKDDKEEFCDNIGISEHTLVDGYELARAIKIEPAKPSFALHKPLTGPKNKK